MRNCIFSESSYIYKLTDALLIYQPPLYQVPSFVRIQIKQSNHLQYFNSFDYPLLLLYVEPETFKPTIYWLFICPKEGRDLEYMREELVPCSTTNPML